MIETYAHGRVNLIGEHTDYNGGWVLPTLIPQKTEIKLVPRTDNIVRVKSDMTIQPDLSGGAIPNETLNFDHEYELGKETKTGKWADYVQGATLFLREQGHKLQGFDLRVQSNVPLGSGLSSSAALEVAMLKALRTAFKLTFDDIEMAHMGQKIENDYIGARVGILDQMAIGLGKEDHALYLDTQLMEYDLIPLPMDKFDLVVINSGVTHNHANGDYNQRRAECEAACEKLEVINLRELEVKDLARLDKLEDKLMRRSRHVITENQRVHEAVKALKALDLNKLGELFYQSHASMRDDYEVSVPQVDLLVELCREDKSVYGSRLTGGGFGGSIVAITRHGEGRAMAEKVVRKYAEKQSEFKASILTPEK